MVYPAILVILLISVCTVNAGYSPLQPKTKSTAAIRGLLGRQINECNSGFSLCGDDCCLIGSECCTDSGGGCCDPGFYCTVGSNGVGGCCLNGEICSGPAPDPSTTTHTIEFTSTSTSFSTSFSTFTFTSESTSFSSPTFSASSTHSSSHSTMLSPSPSSTSETSSLHTASSPTFFAPQSTPTADSGYTNIFVPGNDHQITFSTNDWTNASSSCDSTKQCRKATTEHSSFTYMASSNSSAAILYLDISYELTDFDIYFDGELQTISSLDIDVCTFNSIGHLPVSQSQINITIVVDESLGNSKRQADSDSSFEFNGFLVGQSTSTATSTSSTGTISQSQSQPVDTSTASSSPVKNASKPAGIIASVVMAMLVIMAYF
jgi:hypothetical protein